MQTYLTKNRILAFLIILLSIFLYFSTNQIPEMKADLALIDAKFFPRIINVLLVIFSVIIFFSKEENANETEKSAQKQDETPISYELTKIFITILLIVACILGVESIGIEISGVLFIAATMYFMGMRNCKLLIIIPVAVTGIVYLLFIHFMGVAIPNLIQGL